MRCVQCGHLEDKVIDSRMSKDGTTIRRRRVCLRCDYRYTTYEQIERTELRVVKRDNLREALNREKILRGLVKACEKGLSAWIAWTAPWKRSFPNCTATICAKSLPARLARR